MKKRWFVMSDLTVAQFEIVDGKIADVTGYSNDIIAAVGNGFKTKMEAKDKARHIKEYFLDTGGEWSSVDNKIHYDEFFKKN